MNQQEANEISKQFKQITGIECNVCFMEMGKNHIPTVLERDKEQGVYVFLRGSTTFKVGKAGKRSQARWNSHHYNLDESTPSSFPKSFMNELEHFKTYFPTEIQLEMDNLNPQIVKNWIRNNLNRVEFKIDAQEGPLSLNLLEALVQYKLQPIFEGKKKNATKPK